MEKLQELELKVIEWANDRNFFGEGGATLFGQYLKLREEFGELSGNFAKGKCMKDDIGDVAVVTIIMNKLDGREPIFEKEDIFTFVGLKNSFISQADCEFMYKCLDGSINEISSVDEFDKVREDVFDYGAYFLYHLSTKLGYKFTECLEHSYNEIKDRKGEFRNNVFVKSSDL